MKKHLLASAFCVLIFVTTSMAQELGGKFCLDGGIAFGKRQSSLDYSYNIDITTLNTFGVSPRIGYMINDHFGLGAGIEYNQGKTKSISSRLNPVTYTHDLMTSEIISRKLVPQLFLKYTTMISERAYLGAEMSFQYGLEGSKVVSIDGSFAATDSSSFTFGDKSVGLALSPQLQYMITKSLGVQARFDLFTLTSSKKASFGEDDEPVLDYSFNMNPSSWRFGVFVYFGRKE